MKILSILSLLAFGSLSYGASVTDANGLMTTPPQAVEVPAINPSAASPLSMEPISLGDVSADGIGNLEMLGAHSAASVPESAAAGFIALFGYILMLRRRTT